MCWTRAGDFAKLCNMAMVDLEPVLSEEMINENTYHHTGDLEAHGRVDVFENLLDSRCRAAAHPDHAPCQAGGLQARR